jgi:hypothetical protein
LIPQNSLQLLMTLSVKGSYAKLQYTNGREPELLAVRRRRNVSIEAGRFTSAAGEALVNSGLAVWTGADPADTYLSLTAEGNRKADLARGNLETARALQGDLKPAEETTRFEGCRPLVDNAESSLVWLSKRRSKDGEPLLSPLELQAGEQLRRDITQAQILPTLTSRWDAMPRQLGARPSREHVSDLVLAASQRVSHAMRAVGPEFSGILMDVCGFLKGLEQIERERCWPRRTARIVLKMGLTSLARHYGLSATALGHARSKSRHWGAQDYKPMI